MGISEREERDRYLDMIAQRGDKFGKGGGLLDLLLWCGKPGTGCVSGPEAKYFYLHPDSDYEQYLEHAKK